MGNSRARITLSVAIAVLLLLLGGLVFMFFRLLTPSTLPVSSSTPNGMEWVRSLYGFGATADEQLLSPSSVAIAPSGEIYATDPIRGRVMVFGADGRFRRLLHTGAGGVGKGQFARPESLACDGDGNVYIADSWANKIIVFDRRGRFLREWPVDHQARGVSVSAGKVYVLDVGEVIVFDESGKRLSAFGTRGAAPGQIDAYQGIEARSGTVFVADSYNRRIQAFDERGNLKWVLPEGVAGREGPALGARDASSTATQTGGWQLPQDLTFDGAGRLLVVDAFAFEVRVVDPKNGRILHSYGQFGRADGALFYPTGIDYDATRDWIAVADTQNNRVQVIRIPGTGATAASAAWRAVASPYRYVAIPLALLLATIVGAWLLARRLTRHEVLEHVDPPADE